MTPKTWNRQKEVSNYLKMRPYLLLTMRLLACLPTHSVLVGECGGGDQLQALPMAAAMGYMARYTHRLWPWLHAAKGYMNRYTHRLWPWLLLRATWTGIHTGYGHG